MSRPYTGTSEGVGAGKRPGLEHLVATIQHRSGGALWLNGSYGIRQKRGSSSRGLSVHSTGRAADISRRNMGGNRPGSSRAYLEQIIDWLIRHADDIGLELLIDYEYGHGGRGWKCDRADWQTYGAGVLGSGGGWGDWIHIELDPAHADSEEWVAGIIGDMPGLTELSPDAPPNYPGTYVRRGSRSKDRVRLVQQQLSDRGYNVGPVDGIFGKMTEAAVKDFQADIGGGLAVDGIVGRHTWGHLFG